jgi:hypothetical protein
VEVAVLAIYSIPIALPLVVEGEAVAGDVTHLPLAVEGIVEEVGCLIPTVIPVRQLSGVSGVVFTVPYLKRVHTIMRSQM